MKTRTLVIGDVHGAYLALKQVIKTAKVTNQDTLIFLGDYVDGWSQSAEVIDYLIQLNATNHCVFIRGNHDTWCEEWLRTGNANATWLLHGGQSTVDSYANCSEEKRRQHLEFFERLLNYYVSENNCLFIHAGYTSMHGPEKETYTTNYNWDRTLWEMALTMDKRIKKESRLYPKRLKLYNEIFIGHTPTLNYDVTTPMQAINVWNIDTGAAFYGALSIMDIDTKEYWQSEVVKIIYPLEKGRNKD
jgi:serine/threonine protein phosphatase 1